VVGRDDRAPFQRLIGDMGIEQIVKFVGASADVVKFYAACDVYVGPSLHDSMALPPMEAMACGLPVITSAQNGGAEMIHHGTDGFVLADPTDVGQLTDLIKCLYNDQGLRERIGENAARTAQLYTWERNTEQLDQLFQEVLRKKKSRASRQPSENRKSAI